jgi:hypothetical protein
MAQLTAKAFGVGKAEQKRHAEADHQRAEEVHLRRRSELERLGGETLKSVNPRVDVVLQNDAVNDGLRSIDDDGLRRVDVGLKNDPVMYGPPQAQFVLAAPAAE